MENQAAIRITPAAVADDGTLDFVPPGEKFVKVPRRQDPGDALFALNSLQLTRDTRLNSYSLLYPIEFLYNHLPSEVQNDLISWAAPGEPELFGDMSDAWITYMDENYPDLTLEQTKKSRAFWGELGATEYLFMPVDTGDEHFVTVILRFERRAGIPPAPGCEDRPFNTVIQHAIVDPVRGPDAEKRKRHVAEVLQRLCRAAHIGWSAEERSVWVPPQYPKVDDWSSGLRSFALIRELFNRIVVMYCKRQRYQVTFWDPISAWWNADQVRDEMIGMAARQVRMYMNWIPRVALAYVNAPRDEDGEVGPFAPKKKDFIFPTGDEVPIPGTERLLQNDNERSENTSIRLRSARHSVYSAVGSVEQFWSRNSSEVDLAGSAKPRLVLEDVLRWLGNARPAVSELESDDPGNAKHHTALEDLEIEFNEAHGLCLMFVARHAMGAFEQAIRDYKDADDDNTERHSRRADEWYERIRIATVALRRVWPNAADEIDEEARGVRLRLVETRHIRTKVVDHEPNLGGLARNPVITMEHADENVLNASIEDMDRRQGSANEAAELLKMSSDVADNSSDAAAIESYKEERKFFNAAPDEHVPLEEEKSVEEEVAIPKEIFETATKDLYVTVKAVENGREAKEMEVVDTSLKHYGPAPVELWDKCDSGDEEGEPARKKRKTESGTRESVGRALVYDPSSLVRNEETEEENGGHKKMNEEQGNEEDEKGSKETGEVEDEEMEDKGGNKEENEKKQGQQDPLQSREQQERHEHPGYLEQLRHMEQQAQLGNLERLEQLEQLGQLGQLEHYEQLGHCEQQGQHQQHEVLGLSDADFLIDDTFDN